MSLGIAGTGDEHLCWEPLTTFDESFVSTIRAPLVAMMNISPKTNKRWIPCDSFAHSDQKSEYYAEQSNEEGAKGSAALGFFSFARFARFVGLLEVTTWCICSSTGYDVHLGSLSSRCKVMPGRYRSSMACVSQTQDPLALNTSSISIFFSTKPPLNRSTIRYVARL